MPLDTILLAVYEKDRERLEKLAQTAIDVASPADATVALAHVFDEDEYETVKNQLDFDPESEVTPAVTAKRHRTIRELATELDEHDVDTTVHGSISDGHSTSERIVELAETVDADMVMVGGRTRSATGKAVFGSTAQDVIIDSPVPVTFVRED
jgi:nucleotide-binding universal stress UspA family protein